MPEVAQAGSEATPATLPELMESAVERGRGGWHFHSGREVVSLAVADVQAAALDLASGLAGAGIGKGSRVGLLGLNSPEWLCWAWATWNCGAVLVPLPAPLFPGASFGSQIASLVDASGCSMLVGEARYLDRLDHLDIGTRDWALPDSRSGTTAGRGAASEPSDLAVILCTSGSTSAPKAVRMSHARAIEWATHTALGSTDGTLPTKVTWFPYYHIAGLGTVFEMVQPVDHHVLSMRRFLADPSSWVRLVAEMGAPYAVSPSSIWSKVLDGLASNPDGIDLSHIERLVFNAEMAEPRVLARVHEVCRPLGLRPGTIAVHYASSEGGLISRTPRGTDPRVETVDLARLAEEGLAVPATASTPSTKEIVSCGVPFPSVEVCVGHPSSPLPERREGEVWVRGPGVTDGYSNRPSDGSLVDGWLRVGDLGYLAGGELWVTGRADEVMVIRGEKYHPEDVEWAAERAMGLPSGKCAAFHPRTGGADSMVVVVEIDDPNELIGATVGAAVADAVGVTSPRVLTVPTGTIPRTPNGKLQRSLLRRMYEDGEFDRGAR